MVLRDLLPGVPDPRLRAVVDVVARGLGRLGGRPRKGAAHDSIETHTSEHQIRCFETGYETPKPTLLIPDPDLVSDPESPDLSKQIRGKRVLDEPAEPPGFLEFWGLYPKRVGKADARRAWARKRPPITKVRATLSWQRRSLQWQKGYVPNPATWINRGQWEDEPNNDMRSAGYSEREINSANGIQLAIEEWNAIADDVANDEGIRGTPNGHGGRVQRRDDEAEDDGLPHGRR